MPKEQAVELRWIVAVIGRRLWLIAGCTLLGAAIAFAVSSWMPPKYRASATLLVSPAPSAAASDYSALLAGQRLALTYSQMLTGRPVLEQVIAQLGLRVTPDTLAEKIDVDPIEDTQLIRVTATDSSPGRAAAIADTVAEVFISQIETLQAERYAESLASTEEQIADLSALMEAAQQKIDLLDTPTTVQEEEELARMETILAGYQTTYATLLQNYQQMRLTAAQSTHEVTIFEEAHVPRSPVRGRMLFTILGALAGGMLSLGIAFLLEHLDDTIKTPKDVSQTLGLSTLGEIDRVAKAKQELVAVEQPTSLCAEAFRVLSANVRYSSDKWPLRNVLVTSPGHQEGKSFIVANLAVAMTQAGLRVVAVDADLRCSSLHRFFQIPNGEGLTNILHQDKPTLDGWLKETGIDNLSLLNSGPPPLNPAAMVSSQHMRDLFQELAQETEMVLVDSPPALLVADALALAPSVDAVLLVLKAGHTRRAAARRAMDQLRQVGGYPIGVVLNGVRSSRRSYYEYLGNRSTDKIHALRRRKGPLAAIGRLRVRGKEVDDDWLEQTEIDHGEDSSKSDG
jgi:capsular exopolysaccharide synthesis family protein